MKILPFNFERINYYYVLLTNVAGESIFISNSDFEAVCKEQFDFLSEDVVNEMSSKHFISADDNVNLCV